MKNKIVVFLIVAMMGGEIFSASKRAMPRQVIPAVEDSTDIAWIHENVLGVMNSCEITPEESFQRAEDLDIGLFIAVDHCSKLETHKTHKRKMRLLGIAYAPQDEDKNFESEAMTLQIILEAIKETVDQKKAVVIFTQQRNGAVEAIVTSWLLAHAIKDNGQKIVVEGKNIPAFCEPLVRLHICYAVRTTMEKKNIAPCHHRILGSFFDKHEGLFLKRCVATASPHVYEELTPNFLQARKSLEHPGGTLAMLKLGLQDVEGDLEILPILPKNPPNSRRNSDDVFA